MRSRILFLSDINSSHTQKWASGLSENDTEIGIFSFNHSDLKWIQAHKNIHCLYQSKSKQSNTQFGKLKYLLLFPKLIYIILKFKPHAIHAHYASSYGLLGAFTFFKPFVISAWGSDLTEFPKKSRTHKFIMKFILWRADRICVTSSLLKNEIKKYSKKPCNTIPFGIDLNLFYQNKQINIHNSFTFGCVKSFEKIYNIDKVVEAFYLLSKKYPKNIFNLKLVGGGSMKEKIQERVAELGLAKLVEFTGIVDNEIVPLHLNSLDVLVNVSEFESFGVSVAEAMACRVPVIVSKAEGFKDLVPDNQNAFIADSDSPLDICKAMESCFVNSDLRNIAIERSYYLITQKFDLRNNLKQMRQVYSELMPSNVDL